MSDPHLPHRQVRVGPPVGERRRLSSANLNLRDFINCLVSRGWMSSAKYLNSVQAGRKVFIGSRQLDTDSYLCNMQ